MIKLREAKIEDLSLLLEFERCLIEFEKKFTPNLKKSSFSYYNLRAYIENPDISVVVAEQKDEVIASGYALVKKNKIYKNPEFYVLLGFMYVIPEQRGAGVNKMIIDYLLNWGKSRGYSEFQLDVYAQNESAIRAYKKAGFTFETFTMRINTSD